LGGKSTGTWGDNPIVDPIVDPIVIVPKLWISPDDAAWSNSEKALIACLEARLEKDHQGLACYPKARVEEDHGGLTLRNSPPPVSAQIIAVGILAALGAGETPLATHAEQASCSTPVANGVPPLTHSGEGDNNRLFLFQKTQRAISL